MTNRYWTREEVLHYYDTHWEVTIEQLSRLSGWSRSELLYLLLGET